MSCRSIQFCDDFDSSQDLVWKPEHRSIAPAVEDVDEDIKADENDELVMT